MVAPESCLRSTSKPSEEEEEEEEIAGEEEDVVEKEEEEEEVEGEEEEEAQSGCFVYHLARTTQTSSTLLGMCISSKITIR